MTTTKWNYIALGDSFTWGFAEIYASFLKADLGIEVEFQDWRVGGQSSGDLLESLRGNIELRKALGKANIVTFMIPMALFKEPSIVYVEEISKGRDDHEGMTMALAQYQRDTDGIFPELHRLRNPSNTILRVMDCYLPPFLFGEWKRHGAFPQLKGWWDAFNGHVARLASKHAIPLARVRDAFNGTSGDENPVEYIGEDGWHTNESGAARIAELHRELGYAPLA